MHKIALFFTINSLLMRKILLSAAFCLTSLASLHNASAQEASRSGWTFGALPSVSFDADLGFKYGALANIYYFGTGDIYPEYYHSFFVEASYTTKQYGIFRLSYDSKHLLPNHRVSVDITYMPDALNDFYGFNGYESVFNAGWIDPESHNYRSRAFYKMQRNLFRASADLQGNLQGNLYWNAGLGLLDYDIHSIDIEMLNRNKETDDKLPDVPTLYDRYVQWGLIKENEAHGSTHPYLHGGVTFDTRDRQQNPRRGIHADAFLTYYADLNRMQEYQSLYINMAWRHYLPLWVRHNRDVQGQETGQQHLLTLAYRLGWQQRLAGNSPFYLNGYLNQLYMQRVVYEVLGGANSIRGIMRNRVLGDGVFYANVELRTQLFHCSIGKENFYIGLNPFLDCGILTKRHEAYEISVVNGRVDAALGSDITASGVSTDDYFFVQQDDMDGHRRWNSPHWGAGCGLKVTMNDNFTLSVDWARALSQQDNYKSSNLYINIGYMF